MVMKSISDNEFYGFWSYAFQLSKDELLSNELYTSSKGFYIERNPSVIYLFTNLLTGARVLVANDNNLNEITKEMSNDEVSIERIKKLNFFKNYSFEFDDIDFFLNELPSLNVVEANLKSITNKDESIIENYLRTITEDDIHTLDLDFDDDTTKAFAIFSGNEISAIGRYYIIPTEKGTMDITLVTGQKYRGKGFASLLLKKMVSSGLENGHVPRYRVKFDNVASIKVAEKLGFQRYCHIKALYPPRD